MILDQHRRVPPIVIHVPPLHLKLTNALSQLRDGEWAAVALAHLLARLVMAVDRIQRRAVLDQKKAQLDFNGGQNVIRRTTSRVFLLHPR